MLDFEGDVKMKTMLPVFQVLAGEIYNGDAHVYETRQPIIGALSKWKAKLKSRGLCLAQIWFFQFNEGKLL